MPSTGARGRLSLALTTALLAASTSGCGDDEPASDRVAAPAEPVAGSTGTSPARPGPGAGDEASAVEIDPPACPPGVLDCATAAGTILFVERVDPDGDGDAHFVLLSREGITAPGISIVDVRPDLRPQPLPGPGDALAAAGPVFEGSFGQRQIQAEAIEFERVR